MDLLLFFFLLSIFPIFIIWFCYLKNKRKNKVIVFAGIDRVIKKSSVRGKVSKNKGFSCIFYSFEKSFSDENINLYKIIKIPRLLAIDFLRLLIIITKYNPCYFELYFETPYTHAFIYMLVSKVCNIPTVAIIRGEFGRYKGYIKSRPRMSRQDEYFIVQILRNVSMIFFREPYLGKRLKELGILQDKLYFDHNKIEVKEDLDYNKKKKKVLFLNTLKEVRRPELFINCVPHVKEQISDAEFIMVGVQNQEERDYFQNIIDQKGIRNNIKLIDWSLNTQKFYDISSIFVLPADIIFANYSLLEAMERGLPVIVSDVFDADLIVSHGKNGFLSEQRPEEIAKYIILLLKDDTLRLEMGKEARNTIIKHFNDVDRMNPVFDLIYKHFSYLKT